MQPFAYPLYNRQFLLFPSFHLSFLLFGQLGRHDLSMKGLKEVVAKKGAV